MDPRAESLLRRFAEMESGEEIVTTFLGLDRRGRQETETVRRPHAEITELLAEQGIVEIKHGDDVARLHFDETELLELLKTAGRDASDTWGEQLSDEEGAARFLTVWLDESLATRESDPSGWWEYRDVGFDPIPQPEA